MALCFLVSSVVVSSLAACDNNNYVGESAIQQAGSGVRVVLCQHIRATTVRLTEPSDGQSFEDTTNTFFLATGKTSIHRGQAFTTNTGIRQLRTVDSVAPLLKEGQFVVLHVNNDELRSFYKIPKTGLPTLKWLRSDGKTTIAPCSGAFLGG